MNMKYKQVTVLLLLWFVACAPVFAQNGTVMKLSLSEAKQLALENNANVVNAGLDVDAAEKKVWETTSIGLPQVNAEVAYAHIPDVPNMMLPASFFDPTAPADAMAEIPVASKNNTDIKFTASQLIFSGEYIVGLQASKVYKDLTKHSLSKSRNEIAEATDNAYVLVLVAQESKKLLEETLGNIEKLADETKAYYDEGFVEETDADQMAITVSSIKNSLSNLDRQVKLSYDLLRMHLGLEMDQEIELTQSLDELTSQSGLESFILTDQSIYSNPDFLLVQTQEALMKLDYKRSMSTTLPSVAAFYQYTHKTNAPAMDFAPKAVMGVSVNVPIFASGQRLVQIQQAKIQLEKARNMREYAEQGLMLQMAEARNELKSSFDTYQNDKENMQLSKKIYDRTVIKYKEGISSSLDLTQVHNQYLEIQGKYFQSIMNLMNAKNKVIRLSGKN
ncbi:MAG: TolC family protein [Bacteroidales bacterium]|nr:TolC family protein [Bacteroidales bacterium]MCF8456840.1 TolC family protein [Bacteroidales bacterium]